MLDIRRILRVNSTSAEEILWEEIRNKKLNGLKFKRQHSIGNYVVDFYCASKRLIIELDGEVHNTEEQKEKDQHRDQNLKEMNFKILRISNSQVLNDIETVKRLLLS
ncbi:MAG: endonuclease domain-containing protein [Bacteroidetes bacterium]|nr:endonuclease domain-containing protein [Bacteroidota bacterium]